MRLRRLALLAMAVALGGCVAVGSPHAGHGRTSPHPSTSKSAARHLPAGLHLTLPPAGFAVTRGHSVVLYSMSGRRLRVLAHVRIANAGFNRRPWLQDRRDRYLRLHGGKTVFRTMKAPRGPIESGGSKCIITDTSRGTSVKVCARSGGGSFRTHLSVIHRGHRLRLAPHPPELPGGNWEYGVLSPSGQQLLAQWTGECEVPQPYLVDVATGDIRPIGSARAVDAPEGFALGWTSAGLAVVDFSQAGCGAGLAAGVYLVSTTGHVNHELIATRGRVVMWS